MLLAQTDLLLDDPFAFFVLITCISLSLIIGITFHEASHAFIARKLGDPTSMRLGRITLNPKAHLDPAGTIMLLILGFGWGKPVPVDPRNLRFGRQGLAIVSLAGPAANVLIALGLALLFQVGLLEAGDFSRAELRTLNIPAWGNIVATYSILLNLILAAFNLLPLGPLDGAGILSGIVPRNWLHLVDNFERLGLILLILIIGLSVLTDLNPLGFVFQPVLQFGAFLMR